MMIADILTYYHAFRAWLASQDASNEFFAWITLSVVASGGVVSLGRTAVRAIGARYSASKHYKDLIGKYFLYHPPLVAGMSERPRVSLLRFRRGLLSPVIAVQENLQPRKVVYRGHVTKTASAYFVHMTSPHGDCPKALVLWHLQSNGKRHSRHTVGAMVSTSHSEEPYKVAVILSGRPLPRAVVEQVFALAGGGVINRSIRGDVRQLINAIEDAPPADEFEQFSGPPIIARHDEGHWASIQKFVQGAWRQPTGNAIAPVAHEPVQPVSHE